MYRDTGVRGLGLLVQATGHKSFFWQRKVNSYPRWETIAQFPDMTIGQARDKADELNNKLALWKASRYETQDPFHQRSELKLDELVNEYIEKHLKEHAKRPDVAEKRLRQMISQYLTLWRGRSLGTIRQDDVVELHRRIGAKYHRKANVVVKELRTLFNFAKRENLFRGQNPARGITFYRETKRTRFLQPNELPKLWSALRHAPNPDLRDFVNLALWTGARKSEVLSMRWTDISLDDNRWTVPDPKIKSYIVPLTPEAVTILKARHREREASNFWVFPSYGKTGHIIDLKGAWKKVLQDAGLYFPDAPELKLTQHDLRRTQGSWQAGLGSSLAVIGKSLGHSSLDATQIYSQLNLDPVRASMVAANAAIRVAMRKKPKLLPAASPDKVVARRARDR